MALRQILPLLQIGAEHFRLFPRRWSGLESHIHFAITSGLSAKASGIG
jgi:hypothetical protein